MTFLWVGAAMNHLCSGEFGVCSPVTLSPTQDPFFLFRKRSPFGFCLCLSCPGYFKTYHFFFHFLLFFFKPQKQCIANTHSSSDTGMGKMTSLLYCFFKSQTGLNGRTGVSSDLYACASQVFHIKHIYKWQSETEVSLGTCVMHGF